jgi:predicted  nucleic acid-binding Zn-ribbon protein
MIRRSFFILAIISSLFSIARSQENAKPRGQQKPAEIQTEKKEATAQEAQNEALRIAIQSLANQIALLNSELKNLRAQSERNTAVLELLLNEERLGKVEAKIDDAINYKANLDAREADIQRRLRNIQQEVLLRGGIRREESEAAIRAEFNRALEDLRAQNAKHQDTIAELQSQADRLRKRIEESRKKVEPPEEKEDKD